ncbi:MAG: histidine phosphatase family protein [Clostridia bacterium]|nr:histidine phosphatase family protein [Clostridia bacterium]
MKIYVMRHGRTNDNDKQILNGRNDEDINETGIAQATAAREVYEKLDIDLIVCSPMKRTRHTADVVNTKNLPIVYDERLIERDTGELTGRHISGEFRDVYWNYYSTEYDVEHVKELFERVHPVIDDIKEKYADKNVLIVTHNGVARAIYSYFNEIPEDGNMLNVGILKNCQITEYEV